MTMAKRTLATLLAVMMLFGVFAVGATAADCPVAAASADNHPGYIFCTGREATLWNWILYYLFFGWIWMWW